MSSFEITGVPVDELNVFLAGAHPDPFRILGPHRVGDDLVVRVFRPDAREVSIMFNGSETPAEKLSDQGFFQAVLQQQQRNCDYRLKIKRWDGSENVERDPYCYGTLM